MQASYIHTFILYLYTEINQTHTHTTSPEPHLPMQLATTTSSSNSHTQGLSVRDSLHSIMFSPVQSSLVMVLTCRVRLVDGRFALFVQS